MLGRRQDPQDPEAEACVVQNKDYGGARAGGERRQEPPPGWPGGSCPCAAGQAGAPGPEQGVGKEVGTGVAP